VAPCRAGGRSLLVVIAACVATPAAAAPVSFGPAQTIVPGVFGVSPLAADMDGDGDSDLVLRDAPAVFWTENHDGAFAATIHHPVSSSTQDMLEVGDVDGDGDLDIVGTSISGVRWWENTGGGVAWTEHFAGPTRVSALRMADLDGDGDLDLLVQTYGVGWGVHQLRNDGGNQWITLPVLPATAMYGNLEAADMDGDGDLDLVLRMPSGGTGWYENDGTGGGWTPVVITTQSFLWDSLCVFDMDGDGDLDVVGALTAGVFSFHENTNGDGSAWTSSTTPGVVWTLRDLVAGDVDGDGDLDLVVGTHYFSWWFGSAGQVRWFENVVGDGSSWTSQQVSPISHQGILDLADLDGDGSLDVLLRSGWRENQQGDGSVWVTHDPYLSVASEKPAAADLDGDGDVDLAYGGTTGWRENLLGDGSVWVDRLLPFYAQDLVAGDIDGDGDVDLAGYNVGVLEWWENAAGDASTWTTHPLQTTAGGSTQHVGLADIDGDGDLDVLTNGFYPAAGGGAYIHIGRWLENAPGGAWPAHHIGYMLWDAIVVDVDGDGDLDVAARIAFGPGSPGFGTGWWENLGGAVSWQLHVVDTFSPGAVRAGDIDGDGAADLAAFIEWPGDVRWFRNLDGVGGSWASTTVATSTSRLHLGDLADVDQDGDVDLLGGWWGGGGPTGVGWWDNDDGAGGVWVTRVVGARYPDSPPQWLDVDGGGLPDFVSHGYAPRLGWYENLSGQYAVASPGGGGYAGVEGTPIVVDGSGSAAATGFTLVAWDWDCDGDGTYETAGTTPVAICLFPDDGSFVVGLQVTDSQGITASATAPVAVSNVAPVITSTAPAAAIEGTPWSYPAAASDPGVLDVLAWSLSPGAPAAMTVSAAGEVAWTPGYSDVGSAAATLTVDDGDGGVDQQTFVVTVAFLDADADGMPDTWETDIGLDPTDPADAAEDPDADGMTNLDEYLNGTDPWTFDGPGAPVLLSPVAGEEVADARPPLRWSPSTDPQGDALLYDVEVHADPSLGALITEAADVDGTHWMVDLPLAENADAYWRARAADPWTSGPWSNLESFFVNETNSPPPAPAPLEPLDGDVVDVAAPVLVWAPGAEPDRDAVTFEVRLESGDVVAEAAVSSTTWTPPPRPEDSATAWRVRAVDEHGLAGPWSEPQGYVVDTTNARPTDVRWLDPVDGDAIEDLAPVLVATAATDPEGDAISYVFEVDPELGFTSGIGVVAEVPEPRWDAAADGLALPENVVLYGRVRARDDRGAASPWSVISFLSRGPNDAPATPVLVAPDDGAAAAGATFVVGHAADPEGDPVTYEVVVGVGDAPWEAPDVAIVDLQPGAGVEGTADQTSWTPARRFDGATRWSARALDDRGAASSWAPVRSLVPRAADPPPPEWVAPDCGCATSSSSGGAWGLLLVLAGGRRRRD